MAESRRFLAEISGNRPPQNELSSVSRGSIVQMVQELGMSYRETARVAQCSPSTVARTIQRFKEHESIESLPRGGRPPILNRAERRYLALLARRSPKITYAALIGAVSAEGKSISRTTVYRIFRQII